MKFLLQFFRAALVSGLPMATLNAAEPYPIVDTGQAKCYDNRRETAPPKPGQPFYGQDAQFQGYAPSYTLSADGLTVQDNVTGLTWQRRPDTSGDGSITYSDKLTLAQAQAYPAKLNASNFGNYSDWRLPTIKELYSLINFSGTEAMLNASTGTNPFIDTHYFEFVYGFTDVERIIDSQWATSSVSVANPTNQMFGVNFADGRIKGYPTTNPAKTFCVICVRGNQDYGKNDFRDNGDGTITDRATGLMWAKNDSDKGMNWQAALAWAQQKNAEKFLGHDDWRLPNAKELQSIVDYSRSPSTTCSAAIAPVFNCTQITNAIGQADHGYYWTGTTHAGMRGGDAAVYLAFGRAASWMSPAGMSGGPSGRRGASGPGPRFGGPPPFGEGGPPDFAQHGPPGPALAGPQRSSPQGRNAGDYRFVDVHGAGAQRSDPKAGDPAMFPRGRGPQGDVIRIYNFVRCVRGGLRRS